MKKFCSILFLSIFSLGFIFGAIPCNASNLVIVVDAGHGGDDSGANCVYNGKVYREDQINLKIAKAVKAALEQYKGVTCYLTRSDDSTELTNAERVAIANKYGAHFLLSIHNNDSDSKTANGAEALVSYSNFRKNLAETTRETGELMLAKLEAFGLNNRGLVKRMATDGDPDYDVYYPDGSKQDYYGMIQRAIRGNLPCTLVECGFMSSSTDMAILSNDDKLVEIGTCLAEGIAEYYGLSKDTAKDFTAKNSIDGTSLDFSKKWICDTLYALDDCSIAQENTYAKITGTGADKVSFYLDYMGMSISCEDYSSCKIRMKAGTNGAKMQIYYGCNKTWVKESNMVVNLTLTDEFADYTIDFGSYESWTSMLNFLEFYLTGSDFVCIESIVFDGSGSGTSTETAVSTSTPTPTPTIAPTATPTATPEITAAPTNTPEITAAPAETEETSEAANTETPVSTIKPTENTAEITSEPATTSAESNNGNPNPSRLNFKIVGVLVAAILVSVVALFVVLRKGK